MEEARRSRRHSPALPTTWADRFEVPVCVGRLRVSSSAAVYPLPSAICHFRETLSTPNINEV
jgi:hypothetical protein